MTLHLPTVLSITSRQTPSEARAREDTDADSTGLEARLVEALLGDAMLTLDDLPATWQESSTAASLLDGSDYDAVALGEIRRSFDEPRTGRRIEQQLAVLPRWIVRDLGDGGAGDSSSIPERDASRGGLAVAEAPPVVLDDALVVRHGTVVLALRYEGSGGAALPRALVETASERCREVAETLR